MECSELEQRTAEAFGAINSEFKCLISGFLLDKDVYYSAKDLADFAIDYANPDMLPRDTAGSIRSLLYYGYKGNPSLAPFVEQNPGPEWRLNERGILISPVARFAMYQAPVKFNMALRDLFGIDKSNGPYNSARVLAYLRENEGGQISTISDDLGIGGTTAAGWIKRFALLGLVDFESFSREPGSIKYSFRHTMEPSEGEFKVKCAFKILANADKLPKQFSYLDVIDLLGYHSKGDYIQSGLRNLERKGYLKCHSKWVGTKKYSHVTLTQRGRQIVDDFIIPVFYFSRGDEVFLKRNGEEVPSSQYIKSKQIYEENIPRAFAVESQI